jgi:hypothetical protein
MRCREAADLHENVGFTFILDTAPTRVTLLCTPVVGKTFVEAFRFAAGVGWFGLECFCTTPSRRQLHVSQTQQAKRHGHDCPNLQFDILRDGDLSSRLRPLRSPRSARSRLLWFGL